MKETVNFLHLVKKKVRRFGFWFRAKDGQALGMHIVWQELTSCLLGSLESRYFYILLINFTEEVLSYPSISCDSTSIFHPLYSLSPGNHSSWMAMTM